MSIEPKIRYWVEVVEKLRSGETYTATFVYDTWPEAQVQIAAYAENLRPWRVVRFYAKSLEQWVMGIE